MSEYVQCELGGFIDALVAGYRVFSSSRMVHVSASICQLRQLLLHHWFLFWRASVSAWRYGRMT